MPMNCLDRSRPGNCASVCRLSNCRNGYGRRLLSCRCAIRWGCVRSCFTVMWVALIWQPARISIVYAPLRSMRKRLRVCRPRAPPYWGKTPAPIGKPFAQRCVPPWTNASPATCWRRCTSPCSDWPATPIWCWIYIATSMRCCIFTLCRSYGRIWSHWPAGLAHSARSSVKIRRPGLLMRWCRFRG